MKKYYILSPFILVLCMSANSVFSQDNRFSYSGLGRSIIQNDRLEAPNDTTHGKRSNSGYTIVDEAITVKPNSTTEIQAIVRFRNEYGGFYGNGSTVTFRQLYIKGRAGDNIKYQFGDLNLSLSKYTLFNSFADGAINEASAFKTLTDINYYENFQFGNNWRQQGGFGEWTIPINKVVENAVVTSFITRNKLSNLSSAPEMLYGGGNVSVNQGKYLRVGGNYVNLFSVGKTVSKVKDYMNPVITGTFDIHTDDSSMVGWYLKGETGRSLLKIADGSAESGSKSDFFYDARIGSQLKNQNLTFELGYRDIGPDFFSAGAQTKRINFEGKPALFNNVSNNLFYTRPVSIFDITRDRSVYNQVIGTKLMTFDPTLSNVLPYGEATPNRKGITFNATYSDSAKVVDAGLDVAMLSEIRGEGTKNLRNFMLVRVKADYYLNRMLDWSKVVKFNIGLQLENTKRTGDTIGNVSLSSNIIDAGIDVEVLKNFDVILGAKMAMSKGNEYGRDLDALNTIQFYTDYNNIDIQQQLFAVGLKYRWNSNIDLSLNAQTYKLNNKALSALNYDIRQIFVLFNMKF